MDAKDLRTETTIGERSNNGSSKFAQGGAAPPCNASKTYENISANPLAKLEAPTSRPCAVIGPDRIIPPSSGDAYSKKGHYEPWLHVDNTYRQPPEYPHKIPSYQSPIRNISPRQTFQENMQRIMVQPTYNSGKLNDDPNYTMDNNRNTTKNSKIPGPHEAKYCDVPYSVNPINSDQKPNEMCVTNMNSSRNYPQMWHPGGAGIRPTRPYGAPDLYQFPEYTSCAGPRPMPMPRPHRTMNEDPNHAYSETYYPEGNIRFKPYPTVKERYPQTRYEYVNNYANPFHPPPPFPSHKYDLQKPLPPHVSYPQIPIKYLENRMTDTIMDGYQRPQPVNYNVPYRNQVIHPSYGPMIGGNLQNKVYPYPPDGPVKSLASNKLPYDSKIYAEYENTRNKGYPVTDSMYLNEMVRPHMKNQPILPNYPTANVQSIHAHPYYRKESLAAKNYEYISHLRHLDPSINPNALTRLSTQFSPNSIAISPSDSNTSNETSHTHGGSLEDCGYVSQSSTTSIRSFDSGVNRIMSNDFHQRYNYPYQTMVRTSPLSSKPYGNGTINSPRDKKSIDVRQFLQMWNEGEDENGSKEKEVITQSDFNSSKLANQYEVMKNNEQLYVLGLVNVPSEELGKYEHIQKISKLPENIKGYNNIELLKHFEEAIESSHISSPNHKPPTPRNYQSSMKSSLVQGTGLLPPRPISPLDVEAKISQSVIHKEVGCNFEIKPCSPEMLNAEVATTAQSILGEERVIEKVSNPMIIKPPILSSTSDSETMSDALNQNEHRIMLKEAANKTPSCKMINTQCSNNEGVNVAKANYSLQDLESNAGVCLASLPRLDNDIELNFPEVNQQFINANKESVIIANDFTSELDAMPNNDPYKTDEHLISKSEDTSSVMPILDLETEVSKLSKYRKIKRNEVEHKEHQFLSVSQSLRTDSVIIKNPENTKSFEKNMETPPLEQKTNDNQLINNDPVGESPDPDNINNHEDSNEMAIDFSLSRVENNLINKHNNLSEMYSTKNPNYTSEKLPENTNTACNLPSDCTNDITMKNHISDEVNDIINMCPVSKNTKKCDEIKFETLDIKEPNGVLQPNAVGSSENLSEILLDTVHKETESCNIVKVSATDQMDHDCLEEKTEDEVNQKSINPTMGVEKMDTPLLTALNDQEKDNDTILRTSSLTTVYKVSKHIDDTNAKIVNIHNEENLHSSDIFFNNFDIKHHASSSVECKLTEVELGCLKQQKNILEKVITYNNTIESDVTEKSVLCELVEKNNSKIDAVVKKVSLNKEHFSPRMQNLLLWSEGKSGLMTSLQNKSENSYPVTDSNAHNSTVNTFESFKNSDFQSKFAYVEDYPICNSDINILDVNNIIGNKVRSKSINVENSANSDLCIVAEDNLTSVKDCTKKESKSESTDYCPISDANAVFTVDNRNSATYMINNELQTDVFNTKDCPISSSDAEISSVDNLKSVDDFANGQLQSEPNNVKVFPVYGSDVKYPCDENLHSFKDFTKLQSKLTDVKDCPISGSNFEISGADSLNSVMACVSNNIQLKYTDIKDCENSDSNVKMSDVDSVNSVKDCTNSKLQSESTDSKVCYVSGLDVDNLNSVNDCANNQLQTKSTNLDDYEISKAKVEISSVYSLSNVINCTKNEIKLESSDVKYCPISDLDIETSSVDNLNSVKNCANDKLQSVYTDVKDDSLCKRDTISGSDDGISDADSLCSAIDCANSEHQSESTNINDCPISDRDSESSPVDNFNSVKEKYQSESTNFKDSPISVVDAVNSAVDNLNSVKDFNNSAVQLDSTNIKDCQITDSNVEISNVDSLNSIIDYVSNDIESESTIVKDFTIPGSDVNTSAEDSLKGGKDSVNIKFQSESSGVNDCPIYDSSVESSAVDNSESVKDFKNSELQLESTNVKDCHFFDSNKGISCEYGPNTIRDCANSELQTESRDVRDYPISDSDEKMSSADSLKVVKDFTHSELQSKASYCKESSHIVESDLEIEAGNIQVIITSSNPSDKYHSSNDDSLNDNVSHLNQYGNSNIKNMKILDDVFYEVDSVAEHSGVHDIDTETSIFEQQIKGTDNVLQDLNNCNEHTSGRQFDQIKTIDESPEITMPSNTKGSLIRRGMKRSLSDSALNLFNDKSEHFFQEDIQLHNIVTTTKRRKNNHFLNICEPHFSTTDVLNINNNRRNSICSIYNEENMSFCIVIDNNCIITEENVEGEKLCYTEISEECLTDNYDGVDVESASEIILSPQENTNEYNEPLVLQISDEKSLEDSWVDDVACVETVVSDDIAEDIELSAPLSPTEIDNQENDESGIFTSVSEHTEKVKYIYGDKMCYDDAELVETLYRTPQMDVNKTLINREAHVIDDADEFYNENSINNVRPESHGQKTFVQKSAIGNTSDSERIDYNNTLNDTTEPFEKSNFLLESGQDIPTAENNKIETDKLSTLSCEVAQDKRKKSCESIVEDVFSYNSNNCPVFSSPEVSSTTSEEKSTSLLLKITNYQGTRTSQLNDLILTKNSCKFTENINYTNFISNSTEPRPLITKAAQKYIPPLKETVEELKVKLSLPHDSLMKFKQLKMSKTGVKHNTVPKKDIPKKPKPKFEDVLKSIDEIQFKMHKEKSKKPKKSVPKVVIKKTENGSHYTSTPNRDCFNPDLTGRKWQPWVFIEKNNFIDKMALRRKTKAVYNHRKNTYVFADKFKKYKSMPSAKFVITQPKLDNPSMGQLKYTIRLKHSY